MKRAVLDYMAKPAKPAYFNLKLIYLRAFITWGVKEGLYFENPLTGMKKKKAEGKAVQLEEETLKGLLSLPDKGAYAGLRDYCMILLTLDIGIRPSEALALRLVDINLKGLEVRIDAESAKTRVSRTLPITKTSTEAIKELISARHPDWGKMAPLFCTVDGQPMKRASWWERMRIYSNKLGTAITPYQLRYAFALQRTMGHTDLTMTKRYVALTHEDIRDQHKIASPVGNLFPARNRFGKV